MWLRQQPIFPSTAIVAGRTGRDHRGRAAFRCIPLFSSTEGFVQKGEDTRILLMGSSQFNYWSD
uniref:Uncharacterized protein n=1 Tax=Setaria viridis TaxID=4556 RepID=A0A4U6U9R0_SETVI|nr:hypothetical protein SEVIR_5G045500v2 [Setaria viridis]